ncbi:hypothetical protein PIB30_025568 [Stylosanthes scabra]|uniref:PWI domain-containing protein n=1 Tax=Stylosanthes scabra TaxID=79078 RepID=A0ABU6RAC6_9FABA|nr:hypothetical protein [Stylosanthes scabra]
MSGGFFRGTSADQDTRFSNKQLKLLKSQKFAPELEHLVDTTKVNMEVMKPWITRRVTELLGFEDEVLINFIHSLLDAKEVNGKEIQIQLTGFMEKNTGKFMKELWTLLLSAQKNASGVPQQFLDAKEEELRKKKVENDKITSEIQRKREKEDREVMEARVKKLDGGFDAKDNDTALDPTARHRVQDGKETDKRNGVRGRNRVSRSPGSPAISASPHRRGSPSRSMSKSFSNSRSYSGGRHRSRSISRSPEARRRSLSPDRIRRSPRRRSISPRRHSPRRSPYRRAPYSRRRSRSRSNYRSPSPLRRRMHSPYHRSSPSYRRRRTPSPAKRRRSPSPVRRRRSPSPMRRRRSPSPVRRRRSPSPLRRQRSPSPIRRQRSPSPQRRRSPIMRHRSPPLRRMPPAHLRSRSGSPMQSPSPIRRRDMSRSPQRRSPSPLRRRSPGFVKRRSPSPSPRRSPSPNEWSSQSPVRHVYTSPVRRNSSRRQRSPLQSSRGRPRTPEGSSPVARQYPKDKDNKASRTRSPDSDSSFEKSPLRSPQARRRNSSEDRSPLKSPVRQRRDKMTHERSLSPPKRPRTQKPRHDSPEISEGVEGTYNSRDNRDPNSRSSRKRTEYISPVSKRKNSPAKFHDEEDFSPEMAAGRISGSRRYDNTDGSKKGREIKGDLSSGKGDESYVRPKSPRNKETYSSEKPHEPNAVDTKKSDDKDHSLSNYAKNSDRRHKSEATQDLVGKPDRVNRNASYDSVSEESDKHRREGKDKRKHRKSEKKVVSSDEAYSSDSEMEDRKDAKRRKKEEKKLRKEEKRRRRDEKRRRREERRAEKLKMKGKTDYSSDDEEAERMDRRHSDDDETMSEQKKLEIELRNKALESLKAKKGMNN